MHVEDESFRDTIVDVINYMVLLSAYIDDKENLPEEIQQETQLLLEEEYEHENWRDNGF